MIEKRGGSGGGRGKGGDVEKNVLVMKCNKNVTTTYCGEYLSVDTG